MFACPHRRSVRAVLLAAAATLTLASPAWGDEAEDQRELIVVTGVRQAGAPELGALSGLTVAETPFSLSVYDREAIDRVQARNMGELLRGEPGVTSAVNTGSYANQIEIRGFPIGSLTLGLPNEAGDFTYRQDALFNVEQVTVLRGVSSLLYGGATFLPIGGAVDAAPKRPLAADFGRATAGIADGVRGLAAVDISRRVGELGVRVNLGTDRGSNPVRRQDVNNTTLAFAVSRQFGGLSVATGFEYAENEITGYRDVLAVASGIAVPRAPRGRTNVSQPWACYPADSQFGWVDLSYALAPGWSLYGRAVVGRAYRSYVSTFASVTDPNGDALIFPTAYDNRSRNEAFETGVKGEVTTGAVTHRVTLAGNWARETSFFRSDFANPGVAGDPIPTNIYRPVRVPEPEITGLRQVFDPTLVDTGYGLAGIYQAEWGPVTLIGGARQVWLEGQQFYDPAAPREATSSYDQGRTTPLAAARIAFTKRLGAYVSYAEGLELGGQAPAGAFNAFQRLPVRATNQLEVGVKWEMPAGLLLSAALFDTERPLEFLDFSDNPLGVFVQRGRQRHRGVELAAQGRLTRTTTLSGGALWLDPEQRDTGDPATQGNRPPGVPLFRLTMTAEQVVAGGFSIIGTVERQSSVFLDLANTQRVPAWARLDLGAAWRTTVAGRPTVFRATVDNVTGERYWAGAQFGALTFGVPEQTWRLSVAADF